MRDSYMIRSASTDSVGQSERMDYWRSLSVKLHGPMRLYYPDSSALQGRLVRQETARYSLDYFGSHRAEASVTQSHIRQSHSERYRLFLVARGSLLARQGDDEMPLAPGSGCPVAPVAPFDLRLEPAELVVASIPRGEVDACLGDLNCGINVNLNVGLGRVINRMIFTLLQERDHLTASGFDSVFDKIVELLCLLSLGDDRPTGHGHLDEVEAMVREYVQLHAHDPNLTGAGVARALGWSLRQVQVALQGAGTTPKELIREERLRIACKRLRSPAHRYQTIGEIARASGFGSVSTFNLWFRERIGVSPRNYRREC